VKQTAQTKFFILFSKNIFIFIFYFFLNFTKMTNTLANDRYNPRKMIGDHFIRIIDKISEQTNSELIILNLKYAITPETIANPDDQKELISRQNELKKLITRLLNYKRKH
jgi:hypothetical protein